MTTEDSDNDEYPKRGKRNAMKHGAFAKLLVLPGEDREEFETLHRSLREEFDPQGPAQEDRVEPWPTTYGGNDEYVGTKQIRL
jgi:hypothetical protein